MWNNIQSFFINKLTLGKVISFFQVAFYFFQNESWRLTIYTKNEFQLEDNQHVRNIYSIWEVAPCRF